jgi:hypothetical protein
MNSKVDASPLPLEIKRANHPPLAASVPASRAVTFLVSSRQRLRKRHQNFKEVMYKTRQAPIVH